MGEDISFENKEIYLFGPFRVDATERLLFKNDSPAQLSGNTFDLLLTLVRSSGHLKSRRELVRTLWPNTIVEESNLTWNVTALRQALGDDQHAPRYIETVRGHGYRFKAPVTTPSAKSADPGSESAGAGAAPAVMDSAADLAHGGIAAEAAPTGGGRLRPDGGIPLITAGGTAVLVLALALIWYFAFYRPAPMSAPGPSIAVLPFENLSPGHANNWLAAGIQDTILSKLSGIGRLRVISRTSSERYPSRPANLRRIAAQLGVSSVLEGSVQKVGNQVLINVQLIDTRNNDHIWGQSYTRPVTDLLSVENDIATRVVSALQAKLLPHETARLAETPTHNTQAYLLYLKANYYANRITGSRNAKDPTDAAARAIDLYHQAVERDPRFALVWARLSYLESYIYWREIAPTRQSINEAENAARHALALAPKLPQASLAMGYVEYYGHHNYAAALAHFERARQSLPNDANVIGAIAYIHRRQGKWQEALSELQQARRLDPRNSRRSVAIGLTFMMLRKYTQAKQQFDLALAEEPHNNDARNMKLLALLLSGIPPQKVLRMLSKIPRSNKESGLMQSLRFWTAILIRQPTEALTAIANAPDWLQAANAVGLEPISLLRAQAWALQGDEAQSVQAYKKARHLLQNALHKRPKSARLWSFLGLAEAGIGQKHGAIQAGLKATSLVSTSKDAVYGPSHLVTLAKIYARVGDPSKRSSCCDDFSQCRQEFLYRFLYSNAIRSGIRFARTRDSKS